MKILHVTRESASDIRYGIRKSLEPVLAALRQQGHEVVLFDQTAATDWPPGRLEQRIADIYFAWQRFRFGQASDFILGAIRERVRVAAAAVRYAMHSGITHVHCHDPVLAHAFNFFSRWSGLKIGWGYSNHAFGRFVQPRLGLPMPEKVQSCLQSWERCAAVQADWVIVPSRSGLERMAIELELPLPQSLWHVLPHPRPQLSQPADIPVRQDLAVGSEKLLVAVGQLIPIKRFDFLLEVVARLPVPQPHLLILGEGPEEGRLRQQAERLGLAEKLHLMATDHVSSYLAAADMYISLSSTESYGMANCEALVAGLPAVCTAVGAVPEVLGAGACLVGESLDEIVAAVSTLLSSADERANLTRRARVQSDSWWSEQQVAAAMADVFMGAQAH